MYHGENRCKKRRCILSLRNNSVPGFQKTIANNPSPPSQKTGQMGNARQTQRGYHFRMVRI